MSKVRTFSRVYPSHHPRKGEPTYFVEKLVNSFSSLGHPINDIDELCLDRIGLYEEIKDCKHHTIRTGHHFKVGDWFSPRVWSGTPYKSKQIIIAPDIQIKKVWDFEAIGEVEPFYLGVRLNDVLLHEVQCFQVFMGGTHKLQQIAANDGLEWEDFQDWFRFGESINFKGQIICWNENIEY